MIYVHKALVLFAAHVDVAEDSPLFVFAPDRLTSLLSKGSSEFSHREVARSKKEEDRSDEVEDEVSQMR